VAVEKPAVQSPTEREAVRWGREVGGKDINVLPFKPGSKCAILLHPITPFGAPRVTLEWVADREALTARYHQAQGAHNKMRGTIEEVSFLGAIVRIRVRFKENAISLGHLQRSRRRAARARTAGDGRLRPRGPAGAGRRRGHLNGPNGP